MEVILLENVQNLGSLGDQVKVRPGYGRNYLIPFGKAVPATRENIARFEARRAELEKQAAERLAEAQARAEALRDQTVTISRRVAEEGKLFGSVGPADISDALTAAGHAVGKQEIRMPYGPIRETGEFHVEVHLYTDVDVTITAVVEPEA